LLQINPKGQVPALALDDGDLLTEGPAIVQFLADRAPSSGLIPAAGSKARYHGMAEFHHLGDTQELQPAVSPEYPG